MSLNLQIPFFPPRKQSIFYTSYPLFYKRLWVRLVFFYRNQCEFSSDARKQISSSDTLSASDYGGIFYMNAGSSYLKMLDSVYHAAPQFVSDSGFQSLQFVWESCLSSLRNRKMELFFFFIRPHYMNCLLIHVPYWLKLLVSTIVHHSLNSHCLWWKCFPSSWISYKVN